MGFFSFLKKNKNIDTYGENVKNIALRECESYEDKISKLGADGLLKTLPENAIIEFNKVMEQISQIDPNKKNLLIIDDNTGLLSLIRDILKISGLIDKLNIVSIETSYAGFIYKIMSKKTNIIFNYAIIDITFGGVAIDDLEGNLKYEGIMVFKDLYNKNKNLRYVFYTGNSLNKYVYSSKKIIDVFKAITGDDIHNHLIYKNEYPPSKLINIISNLVKE